MNKATLLISFLLFGIWPYVLYANVGYQQALPMPNKPHASIHSAVAKQPAHKNILAANTSHKVWFSTMVSKMMQLNQQWGAYQGYMDQQLTLVKDWQKQLQQQIEQLQQVMILFHQEIQTLQATDQKKCLSHQQEKPPKPAPLRA